jgi:hypothetical protein
MSLPLTQGRYEELRDQFAAAALTGLLAWDGSHAVSVDHMAAWSYQFADAMLARRAQPTADAPAPASTAPAA